MANGVWNCPRCSNANSYPDVKSCLVCDYEISAAEIQAAEKSLAQYKTEEKKERFEMALADLQKRQSEAVYKKQVYDRKKRKAVMTAATKIDSVCDKTVEISSKAFKVFRIIMVVFLIVSLVIVTVSVVSNASSDYILAACDDIFASIIEGFEAYHFVVDRRGNYVFEPFYKIVDRINYISQQIQNSDGLDYLFNILGW